MPKEKPSKMLGFFVSHQVGFFVVVRVPI